MANSKSKMEVPEAKAAMDRFKTEVASESVSYTNL
ncbi:MAG: alpha/beta-type small acid-soluble spore protein, partial [Lachnospiraceae bacterium]|nr:alpha/beta-type small acid-soluble spore protein [Lachnospiraceae bacterium]